jgi:hypothetical protein
MEIINEKGEFTKELFIFLKYNQMVDNAATTETDELLYQEFLKKIDALQSELKNSDSGASETLGSIMAMFGFSRHYCSISGKPIIGKYYKIGNRIVSQEAYESYKIVQELEGRNSKTGKEQ